MSCWVRTRFTTFWLLEVNSSLLTLPARPATWSIVCPTPGTNLTLNSSHKPSSFACVLRLRYVVRYMEQVFQSDRIMSILNPLVQNIHEGRRWAPQRTILEAASARLTF